MLPLPSKSLWSCGHQGAGWHKGLQLRALGTAGVPAGGCRCSPGPTLCPWTRAVAHPFPLREGSFSGASGTHTSHFPALVGAWAQGICREALAEASLLLCLHYSNFRSCFVLSILSPSSHSTCMAAWRGSWKICYLRPGDKGPGRTCDLSTCDL